MHVRLVLALLPLLAGCVSPHHPTNANACAAPYSDAEIRRALQVITVDTYRRDIEHIEGVRDGSSSALTDAMTYFADQMTAAGFAVTRQPVRGPHENIIAEARGTDASGPILIASAHIDTVSESPGADDDASGLATLLAIARSVQAATSSHHDHHRATTTTIRLIAFALEEVGFVGSKKYAEALSVEERDRIRAVYNYDMVSFATSAPSSQRWPEEANIMADLRGRPLKRTADFIGAVTLAREDRHVSPLAPLYAARAFVHDLAIEAVEFPPVLLPFAPDLERADHVAFWSIGVPAVDVGDTAELRNPHYHASSDTTTTLDLAFGVKVAQWAAAGIMIGCDACVWTAAPR